MHAPGVVRDAIRDHLAGIQIPATIAEIQQAVQREIGAVAASSVRSSLNLNTPETFVRVGRGRYRLATGTRPETVPHEFPRHELGKAVIYRADCLNWLSRQADCSYQAVVTDPPYGLKEYSAKEQKKLRGGSGGVWRVPPSFDGHQRSPLPRFTVLDDAELQQLASFFKTFGTLLLRVLVPGANVAIASNPLVAHLVNSSMTKAGFETRGSVIRLTMTMRGGDRPKNAHLEFPDVSVMPRSMWEPWILLRKPLEGRVQDNLRMWKTGGWRRPNAFRPFGDVIQSGPTTARERKLAPHPSLKPQAFLRRLVYSALPLGEGTVLDPFCGSGSTLAAANHLEYLSVGVEKDPIYFEASKKSVPKLSALQLVDEARPKLS